MKEVTDPTLLNRLEGREVTDPKLLEQLEGGQSERETSAARQIPGLTSPHMTTPPDLSVAIPELIMGVGGAASTGLRALGKLIPPLARTAVGAGAGATGAEMRGQDAGTGALIGGGVTGALETVLPGAGAALRWGTGAKGRIAERLAKDVRGFAETQVPELKPVIESARSNIRPFTRGKTAAALEEVALGDSGKKTLSGVMEQGMYDATLANMQTGARGIRTPELDQAVAFLRHHSGGDPMMDEVIQRLSPSPQGTYSVSQAEELLARIGGFLKSNPLARGITDKDITQFYGRMLQGVLGALPRAGAEPFAASRDKFKAGTALFDMLREKSARQGGPNIKALNEPKLSDYISENRADLRTKFGPAFEDLVSILNRGGQLGTRSIMTPGTGETLSALRQVYGRGQGGAPQIIGSAARTVAPNLGYQPTGRAPYAPPDKLKILMDVLGISATTGGTP